MDRRAVVLLAAVLLVALGLRLPNLQLVPHLTDETGEVLFAHDIAFAGARPLTHTDAYNGPLWPYLLALVFRLAGPSLALPRLFTLALGLGTVALTFGLAWLLALPPRRVVAAGVAGALMATSFSHVLVGSRVAWSNSTTPFWTTLVALALLRAARRHRGPGLVLSGVLGGLALHTHPSVSLFLAALAIWFVLDGTRRAWLRTPWPWLAVGAALAAYSPVIIYNAATGFDSLAQARASTNAAGGSPLVGWLVGLPALIAQLGRAMVGGFTLDGHDPAWTIVGLTYVAVVGAAALRLARLADLPTGRRLPLVALLVVGLGLPLFNRNWQGFLETRYLADLLPPLYAAVGVVAAHEWARREGWRRAAVVILVAVLVALPAWRIVTYQREALAESYDNRRLLTMVAATKAMTASEPGPFAAPRVFVDIDLKQVRWRAGGNPRRAIEYLLTLGGVPFTRAPLDKMNHFLDAGGADLLFLAGPTAEVLEERYGLQAVDATPRPGEEAWGLYWFARPRFSIRQPRLGQLVERLLEPALHQGAERGTFALLAQPHFQLLDLQHGHVAVGHVQLDAGPGEHGHGLDRHQRQQVVLRGEGRP